MKKASYLVKDNKTPLSYMLSASIIPENAGKSLHSYFRKLYKALKAYIYLKKYLSLAKYHQITVVLCVFIALTCSAKNAQAQEASNKGTDFWIAYPAHVDTTESRMTLFITSSYNTTVTINAGGMALPPVIIQANQPRSVVVDPNVCKNVYVKSSEVVEKNKGIQVSSYKEVIVYSHISHAFRSAATLVFPSKVLGSDYYSINYTQSSHNNERGYSQFTIVGIENGTDVEIIPSQKSRTNAHQARVPFTIRLNKGDVYQFQSLTDLSGSRIHTLNCQPIAVFSGSSFTYFCENTINKPYADSGDNLFQQLLPLTAWGKNFVSAPFYNALHGSTDIFRIVVATDHTTVTVNGSASSANGTTLTNPYARGSIITFNSNGGNVISANKPISVAQLQTSEGCNTNKYTVPGDPEMTILSPVEQTLNDYTVYSAVSTNEALTSITKHFINIVIKTGHAASLRIDGQKFPADTFKVINSEYSYMVANVTASADKNPTHRITADAGFSAIAYGYGIPESYGYLAGTGLKNLSKYTPYIEAQNAADHKAVTSGVIGSTYKFVLTLPYISNSLVWDMGNGTVNTIASPAYITDKSEGEPLYKYEYTGAYQISGNHKLKVHAVNPNPVKCDAEEIIEFSFNIPKPPPNTIDFYRKMEIWDFDGMDFDTIALKLNGKQLGPKEIAIQLHRRYGSPEFTYSLNLQPGDNILEIHAINEGVKPLTSVGILLMGDMLRRQLFLNLKKGETTLIHLPKEE